MSVLQEIVKKELDSLQEQLDTMRAEMPDYEAKAANLQVNKTTRPRPPTSR